MRRLRTYAPGACYIEHHFCYVVLVSFGLPRGVFLRSLGINLVSFAFGDSGALLAAQAAQIRDCCLFLIFVNKYGLNILCAGCVDPHPLAFPCNAAVSFICAGCADPHPPFIL